MPAFRTLSIAPDGTLTRGWMEAPSEAAAIERLRRKGHLPMRTEPDAGGRPVLEAVLHAELGRGRGVLGRQELTDLTRELAVMLGAGQDLDRALRFVVE